MRKKITGVVISACVLSFCSVHSTTLDVNKFNSMTDKKAIRSVNFDVDTAYRGNATSKDVKTYIFLCSNIYSKEDDNEGSGAKLENDGSGPGPQPNRFSIGAITVDGDLTEINENTRNIVWSAVLGFQKNDDCSSTTYGIKFDLAYSKAYINSGDEIEKYISVEEPNGVTRKLIQFEYANGQTETFEPCGKNDEGWIIKDEPKYIHKRSGGSVIDTPGFQPNITAKTIWDKKEYRWTYHNALSIGGFLTIFGRCCNENVNVYGQERKIVPISRFWNKQNSVSFCKSFLINAGLLSYHL